VHECINTCAPSLLIAHLQGKLYLYEGPQAGARLAGSESVWNDRRVIRVPPDKIGGVEHVVALCPGEWGQAWGASLVLGGSAETTYRQCCKRQRAFPGQLQGGGQANKRGAAVIASARPHLLAPLPLLFLS